MNSANWPLCAPTSITVASSLAIGSVVCSTAAATPWYRPRLHSGWANKRTAFLVFRTSSLIRPVPILSSPSCLFLPLAPSLGLRLYVGSSTNSCWRRCLSREGALRKHSHTIPQYVGTLEPTSTLHSVRQCVICDREVLATPRTLRASGLRRGWSSPAAAHPPTRTIRGCSSSRAPGPPQTR